MSIPKTIHYCWFGRGKKSELVLKCIESWRKYCPDYKIIEWNEDNFDMQINDYVKGANKNKRWGFVSDYARCFVVEKYGGVYLDTDVELIKPIDELLGCKAFFAAENDDYINTGLGFGAEPGNQVLQRIIRDYDLASYYKSSSKEDLTTCPVRNTRIIKDLYPDLAFDRKNTKDGIVFLPAEYFCPLNYETGKLQITKNTYGIHHFSGSWQTPFEKRRRQIKKAVKRVFQRVRHE